MLGDGLWMMREGSCMADDGRSTMYDDVDDGL